MKSHKFIGWVTIVLICLLPVFLLFAFGPSDPNLFSYSELTHKLGEVFALVGLTAFALTFVLSARIKFIENIFGGLDKVYVVHSILGATALVFLLFHPIMLVLKFVPDNFAVAAKYLLPSSYWSVNFGIIALTGLIVLIYFTLYTKIKYNKWKISHKFLGLIFIVAVLHIFLVRGVASRDFIFSGYYIYVTGISAVGLGAFSYSLFLKKVLFAESFYKIKSIEKKGNSHEIILVPERKPLEYKSGQFIFIRFYNDKLTKESHPFSIASKSNSNELKIIVKNLGDFTENIHNLKVGDKVSIEGPYGKFSEFGKENSQQIWIAGGIGITPFIGMAEEIKNKKIDLYYSVKSSGDLIALDYLKSLEKTDKNFRVFPWITSEKGHLTAEYIKQNTKNFTDNEFYICGPSELKNSIKNSLIKMNISEDKIHEEEFSLR